jgi:hypothetical protein
VKAILLTAGVPTKTGRVYDADVIQKSLPDALERVRKRALMVYRDLGTETIDQIAGVVTALEFDGTHLTAEIELTGPPGSSFYVSGSGSVIGHLVRDWKLERVIMELPEQMKNESKDEDQN